MLHTLPYTRQDLEVEHISDAGSWNLGGRQESGKHKR